MEKEFFKSRLGFILVSAGCAIGLGNVWKFPYMCGIYGGAVFILIYLAFLVLLGLPIMICEFSVGRGSNKSAATGFNALEPEGTIWHNYKYLAVLGNYMLVFFYTVVSGWMVYYAYLSITGTFVDKTPEQIGAIFGGMLGQPGTMAFWTFLIGGLCFAVCKMGLQKGVEDVNKKMMIALFIVMLGLAIHSLILEGAGKGIEFYLVPDVEKASKIGWGNVMYGALSQAFFTLSIGIGSMHIFGCSLNKERSIPGEALYIVVLDTFVALTAGFIIIPACFAYGVEPGAGPGLVFITLPNIFAKMPGGVFWATAFFIFMTFAAASTLIAVYENIIAFGMELFGWSRVKSTYINTAIVLLLSLPCNFGFNIWSWMQPMGKGSCILDLEDFIVSSNLLPLGSLGYLLFCTLKNGWGWDGFIEEANAGKGMKFPVGLRSYMTYVIPLIILVIYAKGYYDLFANKGNTVLYTMFAFGLCLVAFAVYPAFHKKK